MKNLVSCLTISILLIVSTQLFAQKDTGKQTTNTEEDVIENLLVGLKSDNLGLKASCAYYLGEEKADKAVIPLMGILKSDQEDELRIMAALSLFKIGDGRGIYAIQQRTKFEDEGQVKRMCDIFYNMHLQEQAASKK